jgi:hypothetical protein
LISHDFLKKLSLCLYGKELYLVERRGHFFFCFLTPARFFESSAHQVVGCSACLSEFLIEPQLNLNVTILQRKYKYLRTVIPARSASKKSEDVTE